jgi:hypothetical protein
MSTPKKPPMPALAPLDRAAFTAAAVAIPDPVQAAIASPPSPAAPPKSRHLEKKTRGTTNNGSGATQPSRAGKVQLSVWVLTEKRQELKKRALDLGRPVDDIVNELIDRFLRRG